MVFGSCQRKTKEETNMKRITALFLTLVMLLSLTACGASDPAPTEAPAAAVPARSAPTEAPTEAPTTEPTLSPEEVLYNSLPDRMKQAVDVGIVELSQMEDLGRIVTLGEAAEMLQKAFIHRTGVESMTLNDLMASPDYSSRNATRGWIAAIPGLADMELTHSDDYENYDQWLGYMHETGKDGYEVVDDLDWTFTYRMMMSFNYTWPSDAADSDLLWEGLKDDPMCCTMKTVIGYGFTIYDDTNGKKFFSMDDNGNFNATGEVTIADAAEYALIYWNYPNPMAIPEFVAPDDVTGYNTDIITVDLLEKETDLPAASCEYLPAKWHGVVMEDAAWLEESWGTDSNLYEYEIQAIKDAGFNYIGYSLDFNWLQDYWLYKSDEHAYNTIVNKDDEGKFSVERLEQLDRVLALCMKYDIHLNLRAMGVGENYNNANQNRASVAGIAKLWKAIARRYANIPNEYLSFTLFTHAEMTSKNSDLLPAVDAIREVSPDRCIIADIFAHTQSAKDFAQKGVALSYRLAMTDADVIDHKKLYQWNRANMSNEFKGSNFVESFIWPYNGCDAETLFAKKRYSGESLDKVMTIAEENGVGFMLSDFGVNLCRANSMPNPGVRYYDEAYKAMIVDITSTIEERGYGWCFAHWFGYFGIANSKPAYTNATYTQIGEYPCYLDDAMVGWFKEINGVA